MKLSIFSETSITTAIASINEIDSPNVNKKFLICNSQIFSIIIYI